MPGEVHFSEARSERLTILLGACHTRLSFFAGFTANDNGITFHFSAWHRGEGKHRKHSHAYAWIEIEGIVDVNLLIPKLDEINDQLLRAPSSDG